MTSEERDALILAHLPKVHGIVARLAHRLPSHIDTEDLINTGVLGLMDAVEKFDVEKNCKFKTYAEFRVKGAILDQLRALDWVPRSVRQKFRRMENAARKIEAREGRAATLDEMAEYLKLGIDEFHRLRKETQVTNQVEMDLLHETLGFLGNEEIAIETRDFYTKAIEKLNPKERTVIVAYFYQDKNLKEIGKVLGLTESRVSQIRTKALAKLRMPRV